MYKWQREAAFQRRQGTISDPATISAHISSLEKELNVRLFVRNTKEVSLSDNGKDLYKYAKQMVDLQGKIEEHFGMRKDSGKHCITIAASTIPAQYLLPRC